MEKVLYIDENKASMEWQAIEKARSQAQTIFDFVKSKELVPTRTDIENIVSANFFSLIDRFKKNQYEKVKPFTVQFGNTFLVDGIDEKVNKMAEAFKKELFECRTKIHPHAVDYFDYLDFQDGFSVKPEYTLEYFRKKHSVTLSEPEHFEFYSQHVECCRLMNNLTNHPFNEFAALDQLFWFNTDTEEFELNIETYYPSIFEKADPKLLDFLNN